jgi:hypothetical protein
MLSIEPYDPSTSMEKFSVVLMKIRFLALIVSVKMISLCILVFVLIGAVYSWYKDGVSRFEEATRTS